MMRVSGRKVWKGANKSNLRDILQSFGPSSHPLSSSMGEQTYLPVDLSLLLAETCMAIVLIRLPL